VVSGVIKPGTEILPINFKLVSWPSSSLPLGSFSDSKLFIGRIAKQEIYNGEPILEQMLAAKDSKAGLASTIPKGKRAITVKVNEVIAVAGFALPGSYVDLLATVKDNAGKVYTKTVLRRVKVIAIAQEMESDPSKAKVVNAVTLELTPKESEALDVARNAGSLSLSLRNPIDIDVDFDTGTKFDDVFGVNLHAAEVKANSDYVLKKAIIKVQRHVTVQPKKDTVELIKGVINSEVAVE
jgi:pilus assembly protein CpaB